MSSAIRTFPDEWRILPIGSLSKERPSSINPAKHPSQEFEYYSIPAYQQDQRPLTVKGSEIASAKLLFEPGTVLFGKLNPRVEKVWRVANHSEHAKIGSTEWIPVVPNGEVDSDFLYFLFWSEHVLPIAKTQVSGSTPSRQRVDPSSFYRIQVPIPPFPEQRRIAAVLSLVQQAVDQQERLIALTTELKKALMHKLFTEGLHGEPQKETEIGPVPESWEVVPLGSVAAIERGRFTHRPRNDPRFYGGSIPFVQTGDVTSSGGRIRTYSQTLNDRGLEASKVFPAGTVLITIAANIGYSGILEFDSACPDSLIALTPSARTTPEYLQYYLSTQQEHMDRFAPRGTQKNINIQFLKPWPVPLPCVGEQAKIKAILSTVDEKAELHTQKRDRLQELFRTLLHQLMTAQIRVDNLDVHGLEASLTEEEFKAVSTA